MTIDLEDEEVARVKADRDWWNEFGAVIGGSVYGWTDRSVASFRHEQGSVYDIPGFVAAAVIAAARERDGLRERVEKACASIADCKRATKACGPADINVGRVQAYELALSAIRQSIAPNAGEPNNG